MVEQGRGGEGNADSYVLYLYYSNENLRCV